MAGPKKRETKKLVRRSAGDYQGWASGRCVVVGLSGGIAAYKMPHVVNRLKYEGAEVHVIMTEHATQFVTPLTLQTVSGHPVRVGMFDVSEDWTMEHIDLADQADVLVIAPATANVIGKMAAGIADDLLTTTVLSTTAPILVCPAMNVHMYANPVVQENLKRLKTRGIHLVDPEEGMLACGYEGKGRLAEPDTILGAIRTLLNTHGRRPHG